MRATITRLTILTACLALVQSAGPLDALRPVPALAAQSGREALYRPVRSGEVRSAGFLTELHRLPYGRVLGPVTGSDAHATESAETALPRSTIGIVPPAGASYRSGDTVMLARLVPGPQGWGEIVVPTGLARIGESTSERTLATIIEMYGVVRAGQVALPVEPVANPGTVRPVPASGPSGEIIVGRETRELVQVGGIMFVNIGGSGGLRLGDFVEVRRRDGGATKAADSASKVMALAQVVRVGEKSSTIRMVRIVDPDIRAGAPVVRIATLPN